MRGLALGVDLGGSTARAAVVDRDSGEIVAAHKETLADRAPQAVVDVVARAVREASRAAGADAFGAIGVGVAGQCLGRTGTVLARLYPLDKTKNADGRRRTLTPGLLDAAALATPSHSGIAPLLRQLMTDYAATGLPPAYLPQPEAELHPDPNSNPDREETP